MKALVVGGNGFIGSHLVDALINCGWEVTVFDLRERRYDTAGTNVHFIRGELAQAYLLREALTGVDIVFHLAWDTIHEIANQNPAGDVHSNLISSIHLLEACLQVGVRKIVFTSSGGTVYGPTQDLPIRETHPQNPITAYGITKLAVEKYMQLFHSLYGLDYVVFRPSVPYGPRQDPLGRQGAAAVFLYRVAHGLTITIWGDGNITRDYFYITDLVNALITGAERPMDRHRIFNIGGSEEISLLKLLELAEVTVGQKAVVEHHPSRRFDAPRVVLDTRLAAQELDWRPTVSLEEGMAKTWRWISSAIR